MGFFNKNEAKCETPVFNEDLRDLKKDVKEVREEVAALHAEFRIVKSVVFGAVGLILTAVLGALLVGVGL